MKTRLIKYLNLSILLLAVPAAWAETVNCTPITDLPLPTVITSQGVYCFTGNMITRKTSGNAIEIQANNVTIDLNGWKLGGLPAGAGTTVNGIYASNRKKITIRNGTIRGFYQGILLDDSYPYTTSQGHLIEDIRADRNTFKGMYILGNDNIVRRNRVVNTGGSTVNSSAFGIHLEGFRGRVLNNDISGTAATPTGVEGYGLLLTSADGAVVEGNRIDDVSSPINATGIYIQGSNGVLAAGNRITRADFGIYFDRSSSGKYMDNLTSIVTIPFTAGTSVGTNN
ncbi:MAG: hypothetical protein BMS9Abin25_0601 [Gammaproteobacteria bacterium]|nr:MAG: hypothetical protein BMS9Abin25_0601 [Gammaproteobacteria bacterium]